MNKTALSSLSVICAGLLLLMTDRSFAFGTNMLAESTSADGPPGLQEIVVTAQKKIETLQKAPISVDVLTAKDIAKQGITNAFQLQEVLPAVRFVPSDQTTVLIRGLGTVVDSPGVDSSVAYSQDGIYLSHPSALTPILFDLKRVEAVLGPQGTLYGRNTNAGVINFISNDPSADYGGYAKVSYGNFATFTSEAALNLPLSPDWALRLSAGTEKHRPYDQNASNDLNAGAARAKLQYKDEDLKVLLTADGAFRHSIGRSVDGFCPPNSGAPGCSGVVFVPWGGLPPGEPSNFDRDTIFGISADIEYTMPWASLISLTGYRGYRFNADDSAPWYGGFDHFDYIHPDHSGFFTQELRLSNSSSSAIAWVAGVFYSREQQPSSENYNYLRGSVVQDFGLPDGYFQKFDVTASLYQSEAIFGDVTIPLLDRFRLRGGLRLTHETKVSSGTSSSGILGVSDSVFGPATVTVGRESITKPTWKVGADYDLTAQNLLYATASTGIKSGGVNDLPAITGLATYRPEAVTAVEVGSKNRFFDNRVQLNAAVFHYDYKNLQVFQFYSPAAGPLAGSTLFPIVNSQTATFEGGEVQTRWALSSADQLAFQVNVLHNKYKKFAIELPYASAFDLSGSDVPLSPKATYLVNYEHAFTLPNGDGLTFGINSEYVLHHIVSGNYGATNTSSYTQPSYHRSGANLSYRTTSSGWTVLAFVRNVENKAVISSASGGYPVAPSINYVDVTIDPPRTYGLSISKDF